MTIATLQQLKESEDRVEFKKAEHNFPWNGGSHTEQKERRKCFLGYVVALANEGGGMLVLGMTDKFPHQVAGSDFAEGKTGALENEVYAQLNIRITTEELFENGKRVLVVHIPSRPVGKMLKFEGVPLMRTGESLRNMSDEEMFAILSEQEPDFSATICPGITLADLDEDALKKMRESYARKQNNTAFLRLSTDQMLSDLKLLHGETLNYAALILLGKKESIGQKLPQCKVVWEFRNSDAQIHHDTKQTIDDPLFIAVERIWQLINQPTLNKKHPVQSGAYIFDIYDFNETVIREAVLNAIAHRDYTITSEVVIRQYPHKITINNPGGFPKGVTIENILTVSSTPRSRLLTDILEKTGLVERSGQGVDKIFSITLSEGKSEPDYSKSDMLQVSLSLTAKIIDRAFHIFITQYQTGDKEPKLGVEHIITLCKIRNGIFQQLRSDIVATLEQLGLIRRTSSHSGKYTLSSSYHQLADEEQRIGKRYQITDIEIILLALQDNNLKIGELEVRLATSLNRNQIKYLVKKLIEDNILETLGSRSGMRYQLSKTFASQRGSLLFHNVVSFLENKYNNQ